MTTTIHQPNYLPWIGYFLKVIHSDQFILHDAAQIDLRSYTRRCYLRSTSNDAPLRLTVPVQRGASRLPIKDVRISYHSAWRKDHLRTITHTYQQAPHFEEVYSIVETALMRAPFAFLLDLNVFLLLELCNYLSIETSWFVSSQLGYSAGDLSTDQRHINLLQQVNTTTYLSGTGARKYQSDTVYEEVNLQLQYLESQQIISTRLDDRQSQYSILDYLMHYRAEDFKQRFA